MPTQCCLLGVCCPPEQRVKELGDLFARSAPEVDPQILLRVAERMLEDYDLAPKGFSDFILEKYGPSFK